MCCVASVAGKDQVRTGLDNEPGTKLWTGLDRFGQGLDKVWTEFAQALDSLWTAFAQALNRLGEGKECLGEFLSSKTVTQAQSNTVSTFSLTFFLQQCSNLNSRKRLA